MEITEGKRLALGAAVAVAAGVVAVMVPSTVLPLDLFSASGQIVCDAPTLWKTPKGSPMASAPPTPLAWTGPAQGSKGSQGILFLPPGGGFFLGAWHGGHQSDTFLYLHY